MEDEGANSASTSQNQNGENVNQCVMTLKSKCRFALHKLCRKLGLPEKTAVEEFSASADGWENREKSSNVMILWINLDTSCGGAAHNLKTGNHRIDDARRSTEDEHKVLEVAETAREKKQFIVTAGARNSRKQKPIKRLMKARDRDVQEVIVDECPAGGRKIENLREPKVSHVVINSKHVAKQLNVEYDKKHSKWHGRRARIMDGNGPNAVGMMAAKRILREWRAKKQGLYDIATVEPEDKIPEDARKVQGHLEGEELNNRQCWLQIEEDAWVDVSGAKLNGKRVKAARLEELEWFRKKGV